MGDVEEIVRGLSEREKQALASLPRIGGNNPAREFTSLLDLGLANCTISGDDEAERWLVNATELGKQAQHLLSSKEGE
jgi:hypothetical protein